MGLADYSTTAESNTVYMPEGQFPSTVNNGVRGIQADLAVAYNDPGWYRPGAPAPTITYLATNSYRVPGVNATALYHAGRRTRAVGALTGTIQGTIQSATFSGGNTDVVVDWDSSGLQSEALEVALGIASVGATTWIPTAAESRRGIVELATAAEFLVGTDALRALTPALFAATTSNPSTFKLPGGLVVQLGFTTSSGGGFISPNLPVGLTTAIVFMTVVPLASHLSGPYKAHPVSVALDTFTARVWDGTNANPDGIPLYWLVIGF